MTHFILKSPHRNLLEEKLKTLTPHLKGKILDAGSKNRRYDSFLDGEVVAIDLKPQGKRVQKGDLRSLKFVSNSFDGVLSTEVLEYVAETSQAIFEIHRVLKKGGFTLVSTPFMYKVHGDYLRYTEAYLREQFSKFSKVEILPIGNFYTIILDILRDKIVVLKPRVLRYLLYLPYLFLVIFIKPSMILIKDKNFVSGYIILAQK